MKRLLVLVLAAAACLPLGAQTKSYRIVESGLERLLTLYPWTVPDTVYGYMLEPAE